MEEKYLEIICPGCKKKLFIDVEKKIVVKTYNGEREKVELNEIITKEKEKEKLLDNKFLSSLSYEKNKKEILDKKFGNIFKKE
ncbi:MAG TPA: hypothetical protein PLD27_01900 [bacterium]|nr:hypothetical protein [bacterium]HOL46703.1 hypothetical protein [bacterium]HPQ18391.1 hypothetical protein [bacterium]